MNSVRIHPRLRLWFSRLSSLLLLFQRSPIMQLISPQAKILGGSAVLDTATFAIATVVGLGAFDSVAGATNAVVQKQPVANSTTVNATVGVAMTNFVYGIQTTDSVGSFQITSGTLPTGLVKSNTISNKTNYISGTPAAGTQGTYSITIKAWKETNNTGLNTTGTFNIIVAAGASTPATIATHPAATSINSGSSTTLSVVAGGTAPFTYQWYQGSSGTTTSPVGTNSNSFNTGSLVATTSYWVKVTNASNLTGANSNTATVTVIQPAAITTQPASPSPITSGGSADLSVVASGTAPLTYQWYQGAKGVTTTKVGTNSNSFNTGALIATTSYWVKVTNAANVAGADSDAATVTVTTPPLITTQPASTTINSGSTATLNVAASGTSPTFQWYTGSVGDYANPAGTGPSFTTPPLSTTTSYWVRATNNAGSDNSNTATVTVNTQTPFASWMSTTGSAVAANQAGALDMPQGDGVPNLLKYAFKLDPNKPDSRRLSVGGNGVEGLPGGSPVGGVLRLEFIRRKAGLSPGITYTPQFGSSPGALTDAAIVNPPTSIDATWERIVVDDPTPVTTQRFGRVKVTQP